MSQASDTLQCQNPGGHGGVGRAPWRGDPREDDKDNICRLICENPDGVPLRRLASLISEGEKDEYSARNYKFVSRFAKNSRAFHTLDKSKEIESGGDVYGKFGSALWVEPRPFAFTCLRRKHRLANPRKPQEGEPVAGPSDVNGRSPPSRYAKDRAKSYLNRHLEIGSDATRRGLASELATECRSLEGRVVLLERTSTRADLPEHLVVPYETRFTDPGRAAESRERFDTTWSIAAARHSSAVMGTLTTDPSLHDSAIEAANALTDTLQSLVGWLSNDVSAEWAQAPDRVGRRLPYLSALEWTESGYPHLHVVFFGARRLCSQGALSAYLDGKTGRIAYLDELNTRGDRWVWSNPRDRPDDASAATQPREYLSEALRGQQRLAGMDAEEVTSHVESGEALDSGLWKQALYWASGKRLWSTSKDLDSAVDLRVGSRVDRRSIDRWLPQVSQYRFVGVSYYEDLPGHVQRSARILGRPPPRSTAD